MSDLISTMLQWLHAHPNFAGFVTFLISAMESIAIIGTIIPGTIMMTAIGTLAGAGVIPLWQCLIWAMLGAIVGDGISYWIGHYFKDRLHNVWPFRQHPNLLLSGEKFFIKHGGMSVFIGRFVGPVRALVPLVAGMLGMSPLRFTIANVLSAIGWAPAYMFPGIMLGAASLELPPDIAVNAILILFFTILFIILCLYLIIKLFNLIRDQINQFLTLIWKRLSKSRYFKVVTTLLKHHNPHKTYGQLVLAFYFLLTCAALSYLAFYINFRENSFNILINKISFYLFRSLRTPSLDNVMLCITLLGEKYVLLPLTLTVFAWLAWTNRWRTALHALALGIVAAASLKIIKLMAHSQRPWGIFHGPESFSFPSGHTTLSVVFYMGITLLLVKILSIQRKKLIYTFSVCLILAVSLSRLYLGAHWFTDILGGWLLGSAILMLICLSYNRRPEKKIEPAGVILTILLTLSITYSISLERNFERMKHNYTQIDWPIYTINLSDWWNREGEHLPLYRLNHFGIVSKQVLNLQWLADLDEIKEILLKNDWQVPQERNWINVLHRITDVQSTEHLPLVSPLYLDKKPLLVLIKQINGDKKVLVLRMWPSNIKIAGSSKPLWVGSVELIPRTYQWLFNRKKTPTLSYTSKILFNKTLANYSVKEMNVTISKKNITLPIILIKPIGTSHD